MFSSVIENKVRVKSCRTCLFHISANDKMHNRSSILHQGHFSPLTHYQQGRCGWPFAEHFYGRGGEGFSGLCGNTALYQHVDAEGGALLCHSLLLITIHTSQCLHFLNGYTHLWHAHEE